MKRECHESVVWASLMVLSMGMFLTGCNTGLFGQLQNVDTKLAVTAAAQYGVSQSTAEAAVAKARKFLGVPVVADMPAASRILPATHEVYYDMLDSTGGVVNVLGYHWDTIPRIRLTGSGPQSVSVFANSATPADPMAAIAALLPFMLANPSLTNAVAP